MKLDGNQKFKYFGEPEKVQEVIDSTYGSFQEQNDLFEVKNRHVFNIEEIYERAIKNDLRHDKYQMIEQISRIYKYMHKNKDLLDLSNDQIHFATVFTILRFIVLLSIGVNPQMGMFDLT